MGAVRAIVYSISMTHQSVFELLIYWFWESESWGQIVSDMRAGLHKKDKIYSESSTIKVQNNLIWEQVANLEPPCVTRMCRVFQAHITVTLWINTRCSTNIMRCSR